MFASFCGIHHACDCVETELILLNKKIKELETENAKQHYNLKLVLALIDHMRNCVWCDSGLCKEGTQLNISITGFLSEFKPNFINK